MREFDVAVIGAGTVGSMALWQLSQRSGLSVIGIDRYGPAHSHGSFTGESRLFRVAYKEGARYVPLLQEARRMWQTLEEQSGQEIFLPVGALSVGPAGSEVLYTTLATIEEFDLPHRVFDADELRATYPTFSVNDDDCGVLDLSGGGLRSERGVLSALTLAEANGVEMMYNSPVLAIDDGPDEGILVRTPSGTVRAGTVVVAAGSWAQTLRPELAGLLGVMPLALTWFMPRNLSRYAPDVFPVFMRDIGDVHFFGAPSLDGYSLKISTSLDWPAVRTPAELPQLTPAELTLIGQRAQEFFPDLNPEPVRASMHHDAYTHDRMPIIDRDPSGRIVTVAGLSGHGFKMAPILGKIAADLAVDGSSDLHGDDYSIAASRARLDAGVVAPA